MTDLPTPHFPHGLTENLYKNRKEGLRMTKLNTFAAIVAALTATVCLLATSPNASAEPVSVRTFDGPEFIWAFGSFKKNVKIEGDRFIIDAKNGKGGAGVTLNANFAEHGAKMPVLYVEVLEGHAAKRIKLAMKGGGGNTRDWEFKLEGLEPGQVHRVPARWGQPLDPAAIDEPGDGYDPSGIASFGFIGDWTRKPVKLSVVGIKLEDVPEGLKEKQAEYVKRVAQQLERQKIREARRRERREELLANAPHPEDGAELELLTVAGPDLIVVQLMEREYVPTRRVPLNMQEGWEIVDGKPEHGLAIKDGKVIQVIPRHVKNGRETVGALVGDTGILQVPFGVEGTKLARETIDNPEAYRVRADGKDFKPDNVYRKSLPFKGLAKNRPIRHFIFLELPFAMREGQRYEVVFKGVNTREQSAGFVYDSRKLRSPAVNVSHVGFRPDDPLKQGFLSLWMGNGGPVEFDAKSFELLDAKSLETAYTGKAGKKFAADHIGTIGNSNQTSADVTLLDFSDFRTPGEYVVHVPGIGTSLPFRIAENAYLEAFETSMHGLLAHRSGIELGAPFTDYERPVAMRPGVNGFMVYQTDVTKFHGEAGAIRKSFERLLGEPKDLKNLKPVPEAWGGYMDAGDWDRRAKHTRVAKLLFELYEMYPERVKQIKLDLPRPEPSDAIPDVLNEALWNLQMCKRLQWENGAVPGGIESTAHPSRNECSWQESLIVGVFLPDAHSTYEFAGAAARASRLLQPFDETLAAEFKERALRAWNWSVNEGVGATEETLADFEEKRQNGIRAQIAAVRVEAAVELFRLTGDETYHRVFRQENVLAQDDPDNLRHRSALFSYAMADPAKADPELQGKIKAWFAEKGDKALEQGAGNAYGISHCAPLRPMGFINYYSVPETSVGSFLIPAYYLTGDKRYKAGAIRAAQFTLGGNPMGMTLTTGIGHEYPRFALHIDSDNTGRPPPRGITVYGNYAVNKLAVPGWVEQWFLRGTLYPDVKQWPGAEAYFDIFVLANMNEYTIHQSIGPMAYYLGFLTASE